MDRTMDNNFNADVTNYASMVMTSANVLFFNARVHGELEALGQHKAILALEAMGFPAQLHGDQVCIKTHFGALGNQYHLRPAYIRFLCDKMRSCGGLPTVAETCGMGAPHSGGIYGGRCSEEEYLSCALMHGFTRETMGAPLIMLDGPFGQDIVEAPVKGLHFNRVLVAGRLREFQHLVLATHFKGHGAAGFGGTIKNLGIGCVSKGGKAEAHHSKAMHIAQEKCAGDSCSICINYCMNRAITREGGTLKRDTSKCKRCRICHAKCPNHVFYSDDVDDFQFIEQFVDNAKGVVDFVGAGRIYYLNYVIDVTPNCDCSSVSDLPFVSDVGILASRDPVAIDQAAVDLVHHMPGTPGSVATEKTPPKQTDWFSYIYAEDGRTVPDTRWQHQLEHAEKIGLGSRKYQLIRMDEG